MNLKTFLIAAVSLAIGVAAGWIAKPVPAAQPDGPRRGSASRKARIAESKTRVKTVTTVVTNMVHDTVTNTVEVMRERQRGPEGWREEMERLKEENPAEYAARTNRMENFRNMMIQNAENRLATLGSIDTTGWTDRQLEIHQHYQELIAQREAIMEILRPDSGATDRQRKEAFAQMHVLMRELHKTGNSERNILLSKTISTLGYKGQAAKEVREAIETIYSTTQEFGGFGRNGGGHRGPPPPR